MTRIDHDALLAAACEATGLDDFGTTDFEEGLGVLLRSYDQDARLTPLGEKLVWDELIGDLSGRLQVVDYLKREPEIARAELERPIFILGLPRTGTTTLQQIFQQDPESQVLEYWLGVTPQRGGCIEDLGCIFPHDGAQSDLHIGLKRVFDWPGTDNIYTDIATGDLFGHRTR